VIEATSIGGRRSDFFTARKLTPVILDFCNNICHLRTNCIAARRASLFDPLIGTGEERRRDVKVDRLGGLQVDDEIKLSRLLDRQIARASRPLRVRPAWVAARRKLLVRSKP
jgi:hypothetical protein